MTHWLHLASGEVMGVAGLWDRWTGADKKVLFTCCVITTPPNELVAPYHDRMPAILSPDDYATWLDRGTPLKQVHALLKLYSADLMEVSEANARVNAPKNEGRYSSRPCEMTGACPSH
jgi:putative SOS response-associated peptidase YedK